MERNKKFVSHWWKCQEWQAISKYSFETEWMMQSGRENPATFHVFLLFEDSRHLNPQLLVFKRIADDSSCCEKREREGYARDKRWTRKSRWGERKIWEGKLERRKRRKGMGTNEYESRDDRSMQTGRNRQADRQTSAKFRMTDEIMQTRTFRTLQQCTLSDQSLSSSYSFVVPFFRLEKFKNPVHSLNSQ